MNNNRTSRSNKKLKQRARKYMGKIGFFKYASGAESGEVIVQNKK